MGKDTRHQHYVPKCYIEKFSVNGKVDKYCFMQDCSFLDDPTNICHKRDLYEWDKEENMNQIEKRFSKYESGYSYRLDKFIFNCSRIKLKDNKVYKIKNGFTDLGLDVLLKDIVIQMLRQPDVIKDLPKIMRETYAAIGADFSRNKVLQEACEEVKISALKGVGLNTIFKEEIEGINSETIEYFYNLILRSHKFVILKSEKLHFFSGSNPIVIHYVGDKEIDFENFNSDYAFENSDFYFAVSPHICIGIEKFDDCNKEVFITKINYSFYESILTSLVEQSRYCVYSDLITDSAKKIIEDVLKEKRNNNSGS